MNKRIALLLASILVICTMLVTAVPAYAADSGLSLSDADGVPGDTFTYTFHIPAVEEKTATLSFKLSFDKDAFEATSVVYPQFEGLKYNPRDDVSSVEDMNASGQITGIFESASGDADGVLSGGDIVVEFTVKEGATAGKHEFGIVDFEASSLLEDGFTQSFQIQISDFTNATAEYTVIAKVTGVTVNETLSLNPGASETLTVVITPDNATNKKVSFNSDNTAVATVDANGKVTAVAAGTAKITVTTEDGGKTAVCTVSVVCATHEYKTEWNQGDASGHWHDCKFCSEHDTPVAHTAKEVVDDKYLKTPADCQTKAVYYKSCEVCGAALTNETFETEIGDHKFDTAWTVEGGKHFHKCTVPGCTEKSDEGECAGGTATCVAKAICATCGNEYGELADHDYKDEWNKGNENGHWHDCKNCDQHDTQVPHVPGPEATATDPQVCTVCGFEIAPALGVYDVHIGHRCTACPTCGGCLDPKCTVLICKNKCKAGTMNFTDVKKGDKYYSAVEYVYHRELMVGVSDTEFAINENLDRAMIVRILWNLEGSPKVYTANPFKDVASDAWYYDAVRWAANKGLIKGYDAETFGPTDPITREQMVTILHRYAVMKRFNVYTLNSRLQLANADASAVSGYAVTPMQWAVGNKMLETKSGLIDPTTVATRAEVAQTLKNFLEFYR